MGRKRPRKEVVLIRHAKSSAQTATSRERRRSFRLVDAKLSEEGAQAMVTLGTSLANDSRFHKVQTVLCSPLTRALETACIVCADLPCKIVVVPELAEFALGSRMSGYENTGRPLEDLCADPGLCKLAKFKDVDFSLLEDYEANFGCKWWSSGYLPDKSSAQIARLKKLLYALPDERIVVVGHCCNMMKLLDTHRRIPNGVPIWCNLIKRGSTLTLWRRFRPPPA